VSAQPDPPELAVPRLDAAWRVDGPLAARPWRSVAATALVRAEDGGAPLQSTSVRLGWIPDALFVRFDCQDARPWATLRRRDAPLWQEEVVELFLAAGADAPADYVELEVNPLATLFDARVANPRLDRSDLRVDLAFDWPGIRWEAGAAADGGGWWAAFALPWSGLPGAAALARPGTVLRGNLYRIDRPPDGPAEHSAWSPTFESPADFHRPRRFGRLVLAA
jgi:hypothetical protein